MPIALEIVSPEKLLLSRDVEMVTIPAADGEMGVLQGHAPMIVLLRGGAVRLYENGAVTDTLFVTGGFAEVTGERVTVLADRAVPAVELSRIEAERMITEAQESLANVDKTDLVEIASAMDRVQVAAAMRDVAPA